MKTPKRKCSRKAFGGQVNTYSNSPDYQDLRNKSDATNTATTGIVSAINPIAGSVVNIGTKFGQGIRTKAEQFDDEGNLVNERKARNTAIVGGMFDPANALMTRTKYKGGFTDISGKKYTKYLEDQQKSYVEEENKRKLELRKGIDEAELLDKPTTGNEDYQGTYAANGKQLIRINPKNKGKFNATKKATGKSTEELTNSKNPITRKRAIFAQNAAKWNKK